MTTKELVKRFVAASRPGGLDEMLALAAPDMNYIEELAQIGGATVRQGHDGLRDFFDAISSQWRTWQAHCHSIEEMGDGWVLVKGHTEGIGRATGQPGRFDWSVAAQGEDDKVTDLAVFLSEATARAHIARRRNE